MLAHSRVRKSVPHTDPSGAVQRRVLASRLGGHGCDPGLDLRTPRRAHFVRRGGSAINLGK